MNTSGHDTGRGKPCYVTGLSIPYQFLARHLPNLEEFYLMDYFVVEKSDSEKATWDILHGNGRDGGKCSANAT